MNITIPDHFEFVDRAAVISAWLGPLVIVLVAVAVVAVAIAVIVVTDQDKGKAE